MKLRKLVSVAMAGVMTLSLAACGGSGTADTTAAPASTEAAADTTAADAGETEAKEAAPAGGVAKEDLKVGFVFIGDENEGYTAAHYKGAMEMKEALGLADDQIIVKWNIPEDETAQDAAMDLADQGCQIVFANSFGHESYVIEAAKEYPEVQFCHATGFQAASSGLSNMHNYFTAIYEARYVSGVVAGMKLNQMIEDGTVAKDACKIGYVGAYPYAEVISEAADALISDGCVLISQHADTTGAPTACEAAGVPCVGYNISMIATAPTQALTSSTNNWGAYVTEAVQHVVDGTEIPVDWCKGFSDGAVLITELNEAAVAPGTKEKVEEVEAKLAAGELHVFDTSTWTVEGKTLDSYKKDDGNEYISDGYFHESEFASAPAFDILIDGIKTIDN